MSLFGPTEKTLKESSKKEFEKAMTMKGETRKEQAYQMRIALRARAHIDKLFVETAQKAEKRNEAASLLIAEGKKVPDLAPSTEFMKLVSTSGEVWSFLPQGYVDIICKYSMAFQSAEISGVVAIDKVQKVCDAVNLELRLDNHLTALEFLREDLNSQGIDVAAKIAELNASENTNQE